MVLWIKKNSLHSHTQYLPFNYMCISPCYQHLINIIFSRTTTVLAVKLHSEKN